MMVLITKTVEVFSSGVAYTWEHRAIYTEISLINFRDGIYLFFKMFFNVGHF